MISPVPATPQQAIAAMPEGIAAGVFLLPAVTFVLSALALPVLPLFAVLLLWFGFGILAAIPFAANASATRAHALRTSAATNPLHWLLRGGAARVLICALAGIGGTAVLLVGLAAGGAVEWLGALAGASGAFAVMRYGGGLVARFRAPVHDAASLRRWAILLGAVAAFCASIVVRFALGTPPPAPAPAAMTALVSEGMAAHRLAQGMLVWLLGETTAIGMFGPWVEAALATVLLGVSGVSMAALTVAALMSAGEWSRALSVASDLPEAPPPQPASLYMLGLIASVGFGAGVWAETRLSALDPVARPVAQTQVIVERIGEAFYPPGTYERIIAGRDALAAQDAAALAELRALTDSAFDAMVGQVDPFLDDYYSLRAEYVRLGVALVGLFGEGAEAALAVHLGNRLEAKLGNHHYFEAVADKLAALGLAEMMAAQEAEESALLDQKVATDVNPARLRMMADYPALDPMPELRSLGFSTTLETRLGGSVALGAVGAMVAHRVVARLARRGVLRIGARALLATVPLVGTLIAVGSDAAALALEEHLNRATFRAEIVESLETQRAAILQMMDNSDQTPPHAAHSTTE